jgi:hypothetical protein
MNINFKQCADCRAVEHANYDNYFQLVFMHDSDMIVMSLISVKHHPGLKKLSYGQIKGMAQP